MLAISDSDGNAIFSVDEIDNMIDLSNDWQYAYNQWQQDIEDAKHGMDDQFDLYAQRAKSYNDLTDAQKVFVNEYIRATGDITDAEGHLLSEDKILEKAKGYEKFVNEFAELNKLGEGGSVDLTFRPEIDTEELNKKGWEAGEGFATVFSSAISNTDFDDLIPENAEDTVAINFTPIIVDPNTGEFKGVLSEEELYAYAHDVLAGVREDDLNLQIGAKFEGKNAIDEAVADGERIHYLHENLFINNNTVDSWEELRKVLVKTGDDAVQAGENVAKATASLSDLSKASKGISSLASAFDEVYDKGYVSLDTISSIKEAVGDSVDNWSDYEHILMTAKEGSSELNQALSDLTYKILDNTFAEKDLSAVTEEEVAAVLRENGVKNDSVIAHEYLTQARAKERTATILAADASEESISALIAEMEQAGLTKDEIENLIATSIIFNNTTLNVSDKISALANLEQQLGITASKAINLNNILSGLGTSNSTLQMSTALNEYGVKRTAKGYEYNGKTYSTGKDALNAAMMSEFSSDNRTTPQYPSKTLEDRQKKAAELAKEAAEKEKEYAEKVADIREDLAEKEAQFAEDMAEAWKKEHLEQLKDGLKQQEDIINRYKKNLQITDFGLDTVETNDFQSRSDLLTRKISQLTSYGKAMRQEFERVYSIIPQTGDEAEELANRLETLGSDMRDNVSAIREAKVAIQQLRIDAFTSIADTNLGELENELDNIDKRLEILRSDNKDDYKYTDKILSMKSLLPVYSDFDKQRREKQRQDKQLIALEQDTQDKINEIVTKSLQMQSAENAAAREKERQNLIKDMEKARQDAYTKLKEATEDYKSFLEENELATSEAVNEISKMINEADLSFPEPDTSSIQSAVDNVKSIIGDLTSYVDGIDISINGSSNVGAGGGGSTSAGSSGGIPVGAAVYFKSSNPAGHVGIMGANGLIYHNEGGKISKNTLDEMSTKGYKYRGYGWNGGQALSAEDASKVAAAAQNSSAYGITPKNGMCQAWVADVYSKATGKTRQSQSTATKAWEAWGVKGSENLTNNKTLSNINSKNGYIIEIPKEYGSSYTYMGWQMVTSPSSSQYKLRTAAGMNFDSEGYGIINGRKVIATTPKMGKVGDYVNVVLADGSTIPAIIGDIKNTNDKGANAYGHNNGSSVVEFVVDKNSWYGKKDNPKLPKTVSIQNLGKNYFNSYSKGTPFHQGGLALVGDENFLKGNSTPSPEIVDYHNGTVEVVGTSGAEIRNLPKGASVIPAKETKSLLNKIPSYANGTSDNSKAIEAFREAVESGDMIIVGGNLSPNDTVIKVGGYWGSDEYYADKKWDEEHFTKDKMWGKYDAAWLAIEAMYSNAVSKYEKEIGGYWDDLQSEVEEIRASIDKYGFEATQNKYGKLYTTQTQKSDWYSLPKDSRPDPTWNWVTQDMLYKAHTSDYDFMHTPESLHDLAVATMEKLKLQYMALYQDADNFQQIMDEKKFLDKYYKTPTSVDVWHEEWYSNAPFTEQKAINGLGFDKFIIETLKDITTQRIDAQKEIDDINERLTFDDENPAFLTDIQRKELEDKIVELEDSMKLTIEDIIGAFEQLTPLEFSFANSQFKGNEEWKFTVDESERYNKSKFITDKPINADTAKSGLDYWASFYKDKAKGLDENGNIIPDYTGAFGFDDKITRNADGTYTYKSDVLTGLTINWDAEGKFQDIKTLNNGEDIKLSDFVENWQDTVDAIPEYQFQVLTQDLNSAMLEQFFRNTALGAELSSQEQAELLEKLGLEVPQGLSLGGNSSGGTLSKAVSKEITDVNSLYQSFIDRINKLVFESRYKQENIRNDESLTDEEQQAELYKLAKSISSSAAEVGTEVYEKLINLFNDYVQKTLEDPSSYSQEIVDAFYEALDGIEDKVRNFEDSMVERRQKFIDQMEDELSEIEDYIATRDIYNDWGKYSDSHIQAIKREMDVVREYYKQGILTHKQFVERMLDLEKNAYTVGKEALVQAMEDLIDEQENVVEAEKDSLDLRMSRYSSLKTLLQSFYDISNSVTDAQHDINKELTASKTMYEYLNEETRKLLFNQEDYNVLSAKLNDIQSEANKLQREYITKINRAEKENLAEITSYYQMKYETLMKSYEISKAELEVAKKRQQLDNVLNERNVSMFIDGEWRWVANTQDVINAQNELADAQYAQTQADTSLTQTLELNKLQLAQDGITTQINYIESDLDKIRKQWDKMQKQLNGQSQSLAEVLEDMATSDAPQLQNIINKIGSPLANLYEMLTGEQLDIPTAEYHTMANTGVKFDPNTDYMQKIKDAPTLAHAKGYNKLRNAKLVESGRADEQLNDDRIKEIWEEAHKNRKAKGTNNAKRGWTELGEEGFEVLIDSSKHLIPVTQPTIANLNGGEMVFNSEHLRNLWNMAQFGNIAKMPSPNLNIIPRTQEVTRTIDNSVTINGMTVDSGSQAGQDLINALRRYVPIHT